MRRTLALMVAVLGCGTTSLSAKGRQVTVLDANPGAGCTALGSVVGTADPFFGGLKSDDELAQSARNEALNEAAHRGATHVRFAANPERWPSGTFGGGQGLTLSGVAYRCEAAPAPQESTGPGCTKDTDCKGNRICESRTCVDPKKEQSP
jgi:hypothetical protein